MENFPTTLFEILFSQNEIDLNGVEMLLFRKGNGFLKIFPFYKTKVFKT